MSNLRRALRCLALLLVAGAWGTIGARAEDFALQLQRPVPVGRRAHVTGTYHSVMTRSFSANGKESQDTKDETYRFDVTSQVLAVGTRKNVTEVMLTIHHLTREADGASTPLLQGEIVVARIDKGETVLEVRGKNLPREVKDALVTAVSLHSDDAPNEDEILGTTKRHSLGETWPVDVELLTRELRKKRDDLVFTPKDVTGSVKLVGKTSLGNVPCFELQVEIEIRNPTLPTPDAMKGMTAVMPTLRMSSSMLVSIDPAAEAGASSLKLEGTVLVSGSVQGVPVTGKMQMRQDHQVKSEPLAPPTPAGSSAAPPG
ncbi:MAG TPA: hypothetical protein VFE33_04165 [Thermoanaerobaculia bacterium]|nr:hypothetical protein [Thermoanaerobaculia bacterium]